MFNSLNHSFLLPFELPAFFLLYFRFWGRCRLCRIVAKVHTWQCGLLPPTLYHLYLAFLPILSFPNSLIPTVPPLAPHNRPQCVMIPSLCPCVLIVQHPPMSENMQCLVFCSCVNLLRMMVSRFIHVSTKDTNSSFFMAA